MDAEKIEVGVIRNKYRVILCREGLLASMCGCVVLSCILFWSGIAFQAKYIK